jgi:ferric-dicitrate binding protein FerR (iron transport regulator)
MDENIIEKYLAGKASEEEVKQIFEWVEADAGNKDILIQYKKAVALLSSGNENVSEAWTHFLLPQLKVRKTRQYILRSAQIAALLVFVFGLGMLAYNMFIVQSRENPIYTSGLKVDVPLGQIANLTLPDGTKVILNSGTTLEYGHRFGLGQREVYLEGEAFFEVFRDHNHPFIVNTTSLDFKVYGTSFNIEAYPDDINTNATLVNGSLGIIDKSGKEITRLDPGENLFFDRHNTKVIKKRVDTGMYTSWRDGIIIFRNEKLKDIAKKMERWYNLEIVIQREALAEESYYGSIMRNKPVDQILEVLKLTSSIEYKIVQRPDKPTLIYWK